VAEFADIVATTKRAAAVLRDAGIPFLLGGGLAAWAHGGPESCNDVDLIVREEHAEAALSALEAAGMRPERPPEGWLLKAHHGEILVDLIFDPTGGPDLEELFARADHMSVQAQEMDVMSVDDVMTTKLCAIDEHGIDFTTVVQIARALREQVDWGEVRRRTHGSPYARAFFTLIEALGICPSVSGPERRIRVAPAADLEPGRAERGAAT
jgi:Uncharacterised nucleotidyltransferase